jgi:hypothetical protein
VSKGTFPDIIGPSTIAANAGTPVGIRNRVINVVSSGVTAVDNPGKRRTDLTIADPTWSVVTATTTDTGEWLPADLAFASADLVRVSSSVSGTQLTGLDSNAPEEEPSDPTHLVKFVANVGSNSISIQETEFPSLGKQYYTGPAHVLGAGHTVRMTWDVVDRVYRIKGAAAADYIVLDGDRIVLDGNPILNPN